MSVDYVPITFKSLSEDVDIIDIDNALPVPHQAVWFKATILNHLKNLTPDKATVISMVRLSNGSFYFLPRNMRYYELTTATFKSEVLADTLGLIATLVTLNDLIIRLDKEKKNIESLIDLYFKLRCYAIIDYRFAHEVSLVIDSPEILAAKIYG